MRRKKKPILSWGQEKVQYAELYDPATGTSSLQPIGQQRSAERTQEALHGREQEHANHGGSSPPPHSPMDARQDLGEQVAAGSRPMTAAAAAVVSSATDADEPASAEECHDIADAEDALSY